MIIWRMAASEAAKQAYWGWERQATGLRASETRSHEQSPHKLVFKERESWKDRRQPRLVSRCFRDQAASKWRWKSNAGHLHRVVGWWGGGGAHFTSVRSIRPETKQHGMAGANRIISKYAAGPGEGGPGCKFEVPTLWHALDRASWAMGLAPKSRPDIRPNHSNGHK